MSTCQTLPWGFPEVSGKAKEVEDATVSNRGG